MECNISEDSSDTLDAADSTDDISKSPDTYTPNIQSTDTKQATNRDSMDSTEGTRESMSPEAVDKEDMMSMFASVWVKVEVDEREDKDVNLEIDAEVDCITGSKKRSKRLHKNLICDQCDYRTAYKNCMDMHALGHSQDKGFSCNSCDYKSKYPTALQRHIAIRHHEMVGETPVDNGKPLTLHKCSDCEYTTFYKWNLNSHRRKHKLVKQFKCSFAQCNFETAYRHNYVKHSRIHKEAVAFRCDKCPFSTKFEGHITRHLAKIHNEVTEKANKCDYCDFSTKTKWRLKIHQNRGKKGDPIKCNYCEFETFYLCGYKKHKVEHYNEIYVNPRRPKSFGEQNPNLEKDILLEDTQIVMSSLNKEPVQCQNSEVLVNQNSQNKYNIDPDCVDWNNIQVLETDDKEKPFQCHMCAYTSKFKASVQRHFQRHHTGSHNRPYKCVNCDFSTKTKDQIALHNKRSQSDIQLLCGTCKFTTIYKCQFVMHQKCHYAYKCTACEYSCKHKYELQRHYGIMHLGNGIKCRFCEYKASRKDSVLCHETIHTGVKPFKCDHCDYTSIRKSLLDNHVKRYHSDIKKDITIVSESKIQSLKVPLLKPGHCGENEPDE